MKNFIFLFFVITFSGNLLAQSGSYIQHSAFQEEAFETAYELSVPDDFLFLVDDEIQRVNFNPARALSHPNAFVASGIRAGRYTNKNISTLVPTNSGKWFISLGGNTEFNENEYGNSELSVDATTQTSGNSTTYRNQYLSDSVEGLQKRNTNRAEFRLLKVFGSTPETAVAVGIFGGFYQDTDKKEEFRLYTRGDNYEVFREDTLYRRNNTTRAALDDRFTQNVNQQVVAGLEFYRWNNGNDSKHRLFVQKNTYEASFILKNQTNIEELREERWINSTTNRTTIANHDQVDNSEAGPVLLRYEGYKNFRLNWLGKDFFFANAQALYSFGEYDADIYRRNRTINTIDSEDPIISEETAENELINAEDNFYRGRISLGYAITLKEDDFTLFTGFNPFYEYSAISTSVLENFIQIREENGKHSGGILVPLYASFALSDNFSIWGGSNIRGQFNYDEVKRKVYPEISDISPLAQNYVVPAQNKSVMKSYSTNQDLYFGFKADHKSGISAITNFRGSLTSLNNWFFTLRYSY
ncbi:MAG: hypothetical protein WD016_09705 [Balneolaceae bacterium]